LIAEMPGILRKDLFLEETNWANAELSYQDL
jgi:hypothetical protein